MNLIGKVLIFSIWVDCRAGKGTKRTDLFGRCPFCNNEVIPVWKLGSLADYTYYDKVNLLITYMDVCIDLPDMQ